MSKNLLIFSLALLVAIIVVISHLFFGKNSLRQQHRLQKEIAAEQHQIDSLQRIIDEGNIVIKRLQTDSLYIEKQLRTKYGMSRKGEKVFQFVK